MIERRRLGLMIALPLLSICAALAPGVASLQEAPPPPRVARARVGPDGGSLVLDNVRLTLPASSTAGRGFLALGIGGVPLPAGIDAPAGDTAFTVSVSPPPSGPLVVDLAPSSVDITALQGAGGLAVVETTSGQPSACTPSGATIRCVIPVIGMYRVIGLTDPSLSDPLDPTVGNPDRDRNVLSIIAGATVTIFTAALCFSIMWSVSVSKTLRAP